MAKIVTANGNESGKLVKFKWIDISAIGVFSIYFASIFMYSLTKSFNYLLVSTYLQMWIHNNE